MSSMHARAAARGLHELADDIATLQRPVTGVRWYQWFQNEREGSLVSPSEIEPMDGECMPVVPRAIHDALCPALAVLVDDEDEELVVCDRCKLAVENGAA